MGIESSDEMADFLASQWLAQQKILTLDQLLEKYEAINIAQVNELLPKLAESQRWSFHIEQFMINKIEKNLTIDHQVFFFCR